MRDARGRPVGTIGGPDEAPFAIRPRRLLGSLGVRVTAGIIAPSSLGRRQLCLSLLLRSGSGRCDPVYGRNRLELNVSCVPRAITLWGLVREDTRTVQVGTSRGVARAKLRRLPHRFGIDGKLALLSLPADATPRRVTVVESRRRFSRVVALPAARRQCGYLAHLQLRDTW
jgi:hypothetical protein